MAIKRLCSSAIVLLALGLACGASESDACAKYFDALYGSDCYFDQPSASDVGTFKARFLAACEGLMALPGTSFTPAFAEACADMVPTTGCLLIELQYGACATEPGTLPNGAACEHGSQCASTLCDNVDTVCGTCVPTVPAGSDCSPLGSICIAGTACESGTCTAPTFAKRDGACDDTSTFCEKNLVCWNGTCSSPRGLGETCFRNSDCDADLHCSNPSLQGGTCVSGGLPSYASPGQACSDADPCLVGFCSAKSNGTCPTPIADGQPCSATSGPPCDSFATCIEGICAPVYSTSCP